MSRRGTNSPCPGCRASLWRPSANELCSECKQAIKYYQDIKNALVVKKDWYATSTAPHWDSGLSCLYYPLYAAKVESETYRGIFESLHKIATEGFPTNPHLREHREGIERLFDAKDYRGSPGTYDLAVQMPDKVVAAFRRLGVSIGDAVEQAYTNGQVRGESLLLGLADGTMSESQFNAASIATKMAEDARRGDNG